MKEKRRIFILAVVACFCTLVMQAQEVKSVSFGFHSGRHLYLRKVCRLRKVCGWNILIPSLGGFPVLQGKSYYSESNAPWMSEKGKTFGDCAECDTSYFSSFPNLGTMAVYSSGIEVPGLMNKQTAGVVYQQNFGRFVFSPYVGIEKINTGVYGFGQSHQSFFWRTNGLSGKRLAHSWILWTICSNENL